MSIGDEEEPAASCPVCHSLVLAKNRRAHQEWHEAFSEVYQELRRLVLAVRGRHTR